MKIAMVTPEFLSWGGIGSYTLQLAKYLPSEFEMHLICLNGKQDCKLNIHSLGEAHDTFFCNGQFQYKLWHSFKKLQDEHKFDIIHANHAQMPDILMKMRRSSIPSITTVHSTIGSQRMGTKESSVPIMHLERSERMTYTLLPMLSAAEKYYLRKCNNLIFVSEYIKSWCVNKIKTDAELSVIHNGIDTTMFSKKDREESLEHFPQLRESENIVLFSGRMIALKGIETALMAKKILGEDACFVFAGAGDISHWKKYASELKVEDECIFLGPVKYEDMPYLYSLASVFILPSFSESLPLTVLEAMSCCTPVIASDIGGMREIIDNNKDAVLVNTGDGDELANEIRNVLIDDKFANDLKINARKKIVNNFDAKIMAEKTAEAYIKAMELS